MEGRHRLQIGSHLAPVERVTGRTGRPLILSLHSGSGPLASVVRLHDGPAGEHVEPLLEEECLAQPVCFRFRRVGGWDLLETLPPWRKKASRRKCGLPAIEVGPAEVRRRGRRDGPAAVNQRRRCQGTRAGGGRSRSRRSRSCSVPATSAAAMVGNLVEDSWIVSPWRSTMRHRHSPAWGVEKAKRFTACSSARCPASRRRVARRPPAGRWRPEIG